MLLRECSNLIRARGLISFRNSDIKFEIFVFQKSDSLSKLYEMDDSPDRRAWLDKLLAFMEERRTPITTCPTISKNPLDLFRLYLYVKERGGFMEVCKVQCSSVPQLSFFYVISRSALYLTLSYL